jgi:hypothetical protein
MSYYYAALAVLCLVAIVAYWIYKNRSNPRMKTERKTDQISLPKPINNPAPQRFATDLRSIAQVQAVAQTKVLESLGNEIENISKEGVVNAVILDDQTRSFGDRHIDLIKGKDYGRPLNYFGNLVFWLHRFPDGHIEKVPESPYRNLEHSPGECWEAIENEDDIKEVFGKKAKGINPKILMFIIAALAALFILWMAYAGQENKSTASAMVIPWLLCYTRSL